MEKNISIKDVLDEDDQNSALKNIMNMLKRLRQGIRGAVICGELFIQAV